MAEVIEYLRCEECDASLVCHYDDRHDIGKVRYVRKEDYAALMNEKLAIEGRSNQLFDNYNALLERHRRLMTAAKAYLTPRSKSGLESVLYQELKAALAEEEL